MRRPLIVWVGETTANRSDGLEDRALAFGRSRDRIVRRLWFHPAAQGAGLMKKRLPSPAMVVALIALGVALGGTSVAATTGVWSPALGSGCRRRLRRWRCSDCSDGFRHDRQLRALGMILDESRASPSRKQASRRVAGWRCRVGSHPSGIVAALRRNTWAGSLSWAGVALLPCPAVIGPGELVVHDQGRRRS